MEKIVVLGAGTGGTLAANLFAKRLSNEIREGTASVHLIGEYDEHAFQPANLNVAFKGADPQEAIRKESSLLTSGVRHVVDAAVKVDLNERTVTTRSGARLDYDHLILATGAVATPEAMPGLGEGSLNFHTGPINAAKIWDALQHFKQGKVLVAITSVPHKCPPSPNEAAFMLDEFFRRKGIRESVELKFLTPYPRAYPAEHISEIVQPLFEERGIQLVPFFMADSVDPVAKKLLDMQGESYDYDLLIAVPPHRGAQVIIDSGIGDAEGWIPADKHTMRLEGHSEVYAIGDATNIAISKSGVVAHLQAGIVVENVMLGIAGHREQLEYNGRINCPMETGSRRALFVAGTYDRPPGKQEPNFLRYYMKKEFARMYWSAVEGGWSWLFDMYFGETSHQAAPEIPAIPAHA